MRPNALLSFASLASVLDLSTASPLQTNNLQNRQVSSSSPSTQLTSTTATPGLVVSPSSTQAHALKQALLLAASEQDRQAILLPNPPDATNITYQFVNNTVGPPTGGTIVLSGVNQFPALVGTNVAMAIGFVNACGLNVPHSHPRANEYLTVVSGTLIAGLILETNPGAAGNISGTNPMGSIPQVTATLTNYTGVLFPQGSVHYQFNPTCEPAVFAAAFDNLDPGRTQIARNFFSIAPDEVLISATGDGMELLDASSIDKLRGNIPSAYAEMMDSCAERCGIASS